MGEAALLTIGILCFSFVIVGSGQLGKRLGYGWAAGSLLAIPLLGFFILAIWSITESPVERDLANCKRRLKRIEDGKEPAAPEFLNSIEG